MILVSKVVFSKQVSLQFLCSAKIKNIINTEDAKARLLAEQRNKKKDQSTSFVPTNIAVNYVQHNRCEFYNSLYIVA